MALKIIGAGYGRTGTHSMKLALEELGFGPCYHMFEVMKNPDSFQLWNDVAFNRSVDWDLILDGYNSGLDWPLCHFWEPLYKAYPDAKVLLTVRPKGEWYTSMQNTIFRHLAGYESRKEGNKKWFAMVKKIILEDTFQDRTEDRSFCESVFEKHNEYVIKNVSANRLIVHNVGEGWTELCLKLGLKEPNIQFPNTNSTKDFQDRVPQKPANSS